MKRATQISSPAEIPTAGPTWNSHCPQHKKKDLVISTLFKIFDLDYWTSQLIINKKKRRSKHYEKDLIFMIYIN